MGRGRKDYGERSMSFAEFQELVGGCTDSEISRLRSRYQRYCREHRQVFISLLRGDYKTHEEFSEAALNARAQASAAGKTSSVPSNSLAKTRRAGLARANNRKFIKLATRILYLRMTGGAGNMPGGLRYPADPLPTDMSPPLSPSQAKKQLVKVLEQWGVGYDAIRQAHTPFQLDP